MLSGNIDPNHMGRITLGIHSDNTLEIEEAIFYQYWIGARS